MSGGGISFGPNDINGTPVDGDVQYSSIVPDHGASYVRLVKATEGPDHRADTYPVFTVDAPFETPVFSPVTIEPEEASAGEAVTLSGSGFGPVPGTITVGGETGTSHTDSGLSASTTYQYKVTAVTIQTGTYSYNESTGAVCADSPAAPPPPTRRACTRRCRGREACPMTERLEA